MGFWFWMWNEKQNRREIQQQSNEKTQWIIYIDEENVNSKKYYTKTLVCSLKFQMSAEKTFDTSSLAQWYGVDSSHLTYIELPSRPIPPRWVLPPWTPKPYSTELFKIGTFRDGSAQEGKQEMEISRQTNRSAFLIICTLHRCHGSGTAVYLQGLP